MGSMSRNKGKRGELEAAQELNRIFRFNNEARRGRQFKGTPDSPDVIAPDLDGVHLEVKRVERGNLAEWMETATRDAGDEQVACVLHRRNGRPWLATVNLEDLPEFARLIAQVPRRMEEEI